MCFPVNFVKFLRNSFFYRTTLVAAFQLRFIIRKELLQKKVSGENTFNLISVFHAQIPQPKSMSTTTTAFVFLEKFAEFYYHKIFETNPWPLYNWRYKDLSMSRDQKLMTLLPPIEKCPID